MIGDPDDDETPREPVLTGGGRAFLAAQRVARLATVDRWGRPHAIPFCYALAEPPGEEIYFVVDQKPKRPGRVLKRIRNIVEDQRVALVADHYDDQDWRRLEFVLVQGTAEVVDDPAEHERAVAALRERYGQYREMTLTFEQNPVVRIRPQTLHHWKAQER